VSCVNRLGELFPKTPQKCKVSLTPQEEEEEEEGVPKISVPLGLTSGRCLFWAGAYFGTCCFEVVTWHKNVLESFVGLFMRYPPGIMEERERER
jgi:hypothetical protein